MSKQEQKELGGVLLQSVSELFEWDDAMSEKAIYFHSPFCQGACEFDCFGDQGFQCAELYNEQYEEAKI